MSQPTEHDRGADDLRHYGKVTAGLSHELNNMLGTIQQSAGLLEDYIAAIEQGREVDPPRLRKVAQRIRNSAERGLGSVDFLHWFAHSVDASTAEVDLARVAARVISVSDYFARKKRVRVELAAGDRTQSILASAFGLHQLVFDCVAHALAGAAEGTAIAIKISPSEIGARLEVRCEEASSPAPEVGTLGKLVEELGATMETTDGCGVVVHLPRELIDRRKDGPRR